MFKLVIEDDEGNKTIVPVSRDEIGIGRDESNTIRLTERNVSRRHAKLVREDGSVFVEDISARYGTKKNGEKIDGRTTFEVGDVFVIGDYRLTLQSDAPGAAAKKPNGAAAPTPETQKSPKSEFSNAPTQITNLDDLARRGGGTEVMPAAPAKMVIVSSNFAGQEFPLTRGEMVIGRGEECDIIIDHRSVSQTHAKIIREAGGEYKIVDLKSKNGVKVSGEEYRAVHLKRGDIVELGHVKFRFVEAGENYIFTPPTVDDDFGSAKSSSGPLIGGGIVVVLLIVAGVGYMMTQDGPASTTEDPKTDEPVVSVPTDPQPKQLDKASGEVEAQLEKAQQNYLEGRVHEAAAILDVARGSSDASPEQIARIDDLMSKAKLEKPFARHFETGKDHFNGERWVDALRAFSQIPKDPPSNIYTLMMKEDYPQKTVDHILSAADAALQSEDKEEARRLAEAVQKFFDVENEDAAAILAELDDAAAEPVAVAPTPKTPRKKRPKPPVEKKFTPDPEVAQQKEAEAKAALGSGDWGTAAAAGKEGYRHGCKQCARIAGVALLKQGKNDDACTWLKRGGAKTAPFGIECN